MLHGKLAALVLATAMLLLTGCGQPQVAQTHENAELVMQIQTAVSARRPDLLPRCRERMTQLVDAGQIDAAGASALSDTLALAEAGQWQEAHEKHLSLMKGQRPGS